MERSGSSQHQTMLPTWHRCQISNTVWENYWEYLTGWRDSRSSPGTPQPWNRVHWRGEIREPFNTRQCWQPGTGAGFTTLSGTDQTTWHTVEPLTPGSLASWGCIGVMSLWPEGSWYGLTLAHRFSSPLWPCFSSMAGVGSWPWGWN